MKHILCAALILWGTAWSSLQAYRPFPVEAVFSPHVSPAKAEKNRLRLLQWGLETYEEIRQAIDETPRYNLAQATLSTHASFFTHPFQARETDITAYINAHYGLLDAYYNALIAFANTQSFPIRFLPPIPWFLQAHVRRSFAFHFGEAGTVMIRHRSPSEVLSLRLSLIQGISMVNLMQCTRRPPTP